MMDKFFSSLVISHKSFPTTIQAIKPLYNKEFFKRLTKKLDVLEAHIKTRCPERIQFYKENLDSIKQDSSTYIQLKNELEKTDKEQDEQKRSEIWKKLHDVHNRIMPMVIDIPNRYSEQVTQGDIVKAQLKSDFASKQNITKILSHTKLSYINNCYSKSVVGPNSHYYFGIGAKLQYALNDYFVTELERHKFLLLSGLCLVKSALVEACNGKEVKNYMTDVGRVVSKNQDYTTLHLVEASKEALVGLLSTLGHITSNESQRFMVSGGSYRKGEVWFDSETRKISQYQSVHALVWNPSIEKNSFREYQRIVDIIWSLYVKLELPSRLVKSGLSDLSTNEYDAYRIEVWLPSANQWIVSSRISHYLDYISIRSGLKRGHLIDSMIYDGSLLTAAIMENRQTANGRFMVPMILETHMMHMSSKERSDYFESNSSTTKDSAANRMLNYEQRRYLVKKPNRFGHSKYVRDKHIWGLNSAILTLSGFATIAMMIDWSKIKRKFGSNKSVTDSH